MHTSILLKFHCINNNPESRIGALLEDYINDVNKTTFSKKIVEGYDWQRHLSKVMINHPAFLNSEKLLDCALRKSSAKIVPIFYDHLLRANWNNITENSFEDFYDNLRANFFDNSERIPFKYNRLLHYVFKQGWYNEFQTINGTHWVMKQQTKRFNFNTNLENSITSLIEHYTEHKVNFLTLLPDLVHASQEYWHAKKVTVYV
jgi:acyl carrier protein phosphodiesterase